VNIDIRQPIEVNEYWDEKKDLLFRNNTDTDVVCNVMMHTADQDQGIWSSQAWHEMAIGSLHFLAVVVMVGLYLLPYWLTKWIATKRWEKFIRDNESKNEKQD